MDKIVIQSVIADEGSKVDLAKYLFTYICMLRAANIWFHSAHHLTHGISFAGDHAILYDKIYTDFQDKLDGVIEKAIGLTDKSVADPHQIMMGACQIVCAYPSPADLTSTAIAAAGLTIVKEVIKFLEMMFKTLEASNSLSLGLSDMLPSHASDFETFAYLLKQRVMIELEEQ